MNPVIRYFSSKIGISIKLIEQMESKLLDSSTEYRNKYYPVVFKCLEYFVYFSRVFASLQFLLSYKRIKIHGIVNTTRYSNAMKRILATQYVALVTDLRKYTRVLGSIPSLRVKRVEAGGRSVRLTEEKSRGYVAREAKPCSDETL